MSVHYKFKSSREKHTVIFDGLHISVADLKKAIMNQRKIGKSADLDLQITNPQTGDVYESDSSLIPKNTSVEVARVPVSGNHKKQWDRFDNNSTKGANSPSHKDVENITKSSNISTSYGTEDEKIKAMMSQSTQDYDPSKYVKNRGPIGPLPANYTCYRCGQPGHYIKQCPTNNTDVKRSTGIPRSFMIPANADQKGALLTASGDYAVPIIDHQAYKEVKKEKPPFMPTVESDKEEQVLEIPEDLKCTICQDLLQDAVLIPCCGNSYCDECVRNLLLESESHQCPTCSELNVSPDTLIPNRYLRTAVTKFKIETGYQKHAKYGTFTPKPTEPIAKPVEQTKPEVVVTDTKVEEVVKSDETVVPLEPKIVTENELKLEPSPQSDTVLNTELTPTHDCLSTDVTMDEVLLGSPKLQDIVPNGIDLKDIQISDEIISNAEENNESIEDGTDSQLENKSTNGPNTPLVDEPSDASYETTTDQTMHMEANPVMSLAQYPTHSMVAMPGFPRPRSMVPMRGMAIRTVGQQTNSTLLPHPRQPYQRTGLNQAYRQMDPRGFPIPMTHTIPPYGYPPQMRAPAYHDPYGYMGPRSHLPSGPLHHPLGHPSTGEAPPPGMTSIMTDSHYYYNNPEQHDDYEDRYRQFTRHLESRGRRRPVRSISRSRSPRNHRSSRSRSSSSSSTSSSTSSSSSQFTLSSRSFSGSSRSRSRSFSKRRRSRSRSHYRRRSRSVSPRRREYRYRRSRSPQYSERRHSDRNRDRYEKDRDRDVKYRDSRNSRRDERKEVSHRSSRRTDDRKKDSKSTHSSKCIHKSGHDKTRTEKTSEQKAPTKEEPNDKCSENVVKTEPIIGSTEEKFESVLNEMTAENIVNEMIAENTSEPIVDIKSNEVNIESISNIESKVENCVENDMNSVKTESILITIPNDLHLESVDTIKPEISAEKEDKSKSKDTKKKSKEKSKKHHKHHHHKHRKSSDEKESKPSDDVKNGSNKHSKRHKKSDSEKRPKSTETERRVKASEPEKRQKTTESDKRSKGSEADKRQKTSETDKRPKTTESDKRSKTTESDKRPKSSDSEKRSKTSESDKRQKTAESERRQKRSDDKRQKKSDKRQKSSNSEKPSDEKKRSKDIKSEIKQCFAEQTADSVFDKLDK